MDHPPDDASTPAPTAKVVAGKAGWFRADQLVVALSHLDLLCDELDGLGAAPALRDRSERLGLALLDVDAAAGCRGLGRQHATALAAARERAAEDHLSHSDLHVLVVALRTILSQRYAGWAPTFGKNRLVDRVDGLQKFDYEGGPEEEGAVEPEQAFDYEAVHPRPQGGASPDQAFDYEGYVGPRPIPSPDSFERRVLPAEQRTARVGVIDTRIAPHPFLLGAFVASSDDIRRGGDQEDASTSPHHATFVAGLVLRQAPGAVIELDRGLMDNGSRDSWSLATAIASMAEAGIDVLNLSLGCFTDDGQPPLVLATALAALGPQTLVVAAAGNHGDPGSPHAPLPCWPAAFDDVVAVGALDGEAAAPFSPEAPWVDVMADGAHVVSTFVDLDGRAGLATWSGTSFASALVTGAVAAVVAAEGVDAPGAWRLLRDKVDSGPGRRPVVPSCSPKGWPADGRRPRHDG